MERDAEIKGRNGTNRTRLHNAPWYNDAETAQLLLEPGAEIEARNVNNLTVLHGAAWNNSTETVKQLMERGGEAIKIVFKIYLILK